MSPELTAAIEAALLARHSLTPAIREDAPPHTATLAEGIERYGKGPAFDLWVVWRSLENLRIVWEAEQPQPEIRTARTME